MHYMSDVVPRSAQDPWRGVDGTHLSAQTMACLAERPLARALVDSVWNTLTELERAGQHPGPIAALRRVLTHHQPTSTGRCRTCRRVTWRRRFPCIVWYQIQGELLGIFADAGCHRRSADTGVPP